MAYQNKRLHMSSDHWPRISTKRLSIGLWSREQMRDSLMMMPISGSSQPSQWKSWLHISEKLWTYFGLFVVWLRRKMIHGIQQPNQWLLALVCQYIKNNKNITSKIIIVLSSDNAGLWEKNTRGWFCFSFHVYQLCVIANT